MELQLDKQFIIQKSQEYTESSSIVNKVKGYQDSSSKFLKNLHKIPLYYIQDILDKKPEYALATHLNQHFLHFAAKTNDPDLLGLAINKSVKQGLTSYPLIDMQYRHENYQFNIFNFCILNDLDVSYSIFFTRLSNPEKLDFKQHYSLSLENNSKCLKFLNNIITNDVKQNWAFNHLSYLVDNQHYGDIEFILKKYDTASQFFNNGINLHYCEDNKKNYFELFCLMFDNNFSYDVSNKKDIFVDKLLNMYNYFLDNGFILDTVSSFDKNPRQILEAQINSLNRKTHLFDKNYEFNNELIKFNKKSLENELKINNTLKNEIVDVEVSLIEAKSKKLKI